MTIGSMVRGFKIGVTKWFRQQADIPTSWQRNYYEHVIRSDGDYLKSPNTSRQIRKNGKMIVTLFELPI